MTPERLEEIELRDLPDGGMISELIAEVKRLRKIERAARQIGNCTAGGSDH